MNILVTGGAGYIGIHTIIELVSDGHSVIVVDNFINSNAESIYRAEKITGKPIPVFNFDVRDGDKLEKVFLENKFEAIIHFAGLKSVGKSVSSPLEYYSNNITSTLVLLSLAAKFNVNKIVFSSSATVYGTPEHLPLTEESRVGVGITNPYGHTKFMLEQVLRDVSTADSTAEITILRYFNPVGAHESGLIGEDPSNTPNNILPYISQVAVGKLEKVSIFGDDYNTPDGTGVRDYIHVVDLAKGHVAALRHSKPGVSVYNLCTGTGTSVLELIKAFGHAASKDIPYEIVARRPGDIGSCYASPRKVNRELGWRAEKSIQDACVDSWRWQSTNPNGYT